MGGFHESYLGRLREIVGDRLIIMPGSRVVVEDAQGRVLLQQRSDFGLWGVPGGAPEEGENLTSSAVRELLEETGLRGQPIPFGFASDPVFETITYPNGHRCQYFVLLYAVRTFDGAPRVADDESYAVEWFAPGELPMMLPNMRRTVEAYLRFKVTREFQVIQSQAAGSTMRRRELWCAIHPPLALTKLFGRIRSMHGASGSRQQLTWGRA